MFYYFGRKWALAARYPRPAHELVVEPFAGSMSYSLFHRPTRALGLDADPNVVDAWHHATSRTRASLAAHPLPDVGARITDRWQMMAASSHGTAVATSALVTDRLRRDLRNQASFAARHVDYARRAIDYQLGHYRDAPDVEATWFIDPPYQHVLRGYTRADLDFEELGAWCRTRRGLVIVCEQLGADWLPFEPLASIVGTTNKATTEAVWVNRPDLTERLFT